MIDNDDEIYISGGGETEIPRQLRKIPGIRFIRVGENKRPHDTRWNTDNNFAANDAKLVRWLKGGQNYGVCGGSGKITVLDDDSEGLLEERGLYAALPRSFQSRTGSGGIHTWFICKDAVSTTLVLDGKQVGEIKHTGTYAMGPGSLHPSGERYTINDDCDVKEISWAELTNALATIGVVTGKAKKPTKSTTPGLNSAALRAAEFEVDLRDIAMPRGARRVGDEIVGEHPLHGALKREDKGKSRNFSINVRKNVWVCRAHGDSGGGWQHFLAVEMGLIRCEDAGKRPLTKDERRKVYIEARRRGLIKERKNPREIPGAARRAAPGNAIERTLPSIPPIAPDGKIVMLRAAQRSGKTHAVVMWMKQTLTGNYMTHSHAIADHAWRIAIESGMTRCVRLEGKAQPGMCNNDKQLDCADCPYKPSKDNFMKMEEKAAKLLRTKKNLSKNDIPKNMCPYFTLWMAEKYANYCFTVVNYAERIQRRKIEIIDEDPAVRYFYPASVELAEEGKRRGQRWRKDALERLSPELEGLKESRKYKKFAEKLLEIKKIIDAGPDQATITQGVTDALRDWEPPVIRNLDDLEFEEDDEVGVGDLVKCLMHVYKEAPLSIRTAKRGATEGTTMYLMADERKPVIQTGWMEQAGKIVIIGQKIAEMFAREMDGEIITIPGFRFEKNFVVLAVGLNDEEKEWWAKRRGETATTQRKVLEIAREVARPTKNGNRRPLLVLAGSKRMQRAAKQVLQNMISSTREREEEHQRLWTTGMPVSIYQNSVVSRGVDVDYYNVIFAVQTDFKQPFWDMVDRDTADAIRVDETQNCVLRISPTLRGNPETAKIVVIPEEDLWKIPILESRVIRTTKDAKTLGAVIKALDVTGESQLVGTAMKMVKTGRSCTNFMKIVKDKLDNGEMLVDPEDIEDAATMINDWLTRQPGYKDAREIANELHIQLWMVEAGLANLYAKRRVVQIWRRQQGEKIRRYKADRLEREDDTDMREATWAKRLKAK